MSTIPTIKKLKIRVDPNSTPQEVGDMMSKGLHMMKDFEHEMHHHPFGHKLISIGKPMMFGGLHNALGMMEPEVMHHMCHHKGHHGCKQMINNIIKGIILFLIWKIFESIDNRCCGMCESECIKKFKDDLNECYSKISKVNNLLNESSLVLTDAHKIAMKVKGLEILNDYFTEAVYNPLADPSVTRILNAINFVGYKIFDPGSRVPKIKDPKVLKQIMVDPTVKRVLATKRIPPTELSRVLTILRKTIPSQALATERQKVKYNPLAKM